MADGDCAHSMSAGEQETREVVACGKALTGDVLQAYLAELGVLMASHAMHAWLFFKHPAYANEREYRFLRVFEAGEPAPGLRMRMRPYDLTRYIEFDWRSGSPRTLRSVVVGPAANWAKASRFADSCISAFHPQNISLLRS